jgi:acetyl-CoA carboxylase carboxyl transferase subunit beta
MTVLSPAPGTAVSGIDAKWGPCRGCGALIYRPRLRRNLGVCPECGHHGRLGARERLDQLLDPGSFTPAPTAYRATDVLEFTDTRPYPERLAAARARTGLDDAALHGTGAVLGHPVVCVAMDFAFLGGSMGAALGAAVTAAAETAAETRTPLVAITASGGARMQEGAVALMQMARTAQAFELLRDSGVLSVCVLTDPTYGGVTASFATLGDVLLAERGSMIGFAGPRVVRQATGRDLPEGFQTAEYLRDRGMLDRVEPREALRGTLGRVLGMAAAAPAAPRPAAMPAAPDPVPGGTSAWERVTAARDPRRPTTLDYLTGVCDDFVELHGDRVGGDDPAIVAGLASLDGRGVVVVGHEKGHDTRERVARNFGMAHPAGYRKALRVMRLADRLGLPVLTLVDTQGAHPGLEAERDGQAWAIAEAIAGMSRLTVPVVATVIGEGGSGGALGIAVADRVLMLENTCYSVISPESCSTILYGDPGHREAAAEALRMTPGELLRLGIVDDVVPEPEGGAQADPEGAARLLRAALTAALADLDGLPRAELRARRHLRFHRIAPVEEVAR